MKDTESGAEEEDDCAKGLSFGMLSRLISEGRTGEVPMKQIPEGTNVGSAFQYRGVVIVTDVEGGPT